MNITKILTVPTGKIAIATGERGLKLECLYVHDYGKSANVKAKFLCIHRDIDTVKHTSLQPLSEKLVVTISSQYGCSMNCSFCDVPKVGKGVNVTLQDLEDQVDGMVYLSECSEGSRLNIHYARMGEPTFNKHVLTHARSLLDGYGDMFETVHPVISTMLPRRNSELIKFLEEWMDIKNNIFKGEAGLQLSINSTNDYERESMFNGSSIDFDAAGNIGLFLSENCPPVGRKITLNFALANYEIDPSKLLKYFSPSHFICKLTPMHMTNSVSENDVKFVQDYRQVENDLIEAGYDVIVFIPSEEEDGGRITCGNAILSGSAPTVPYSVNLIYNKDKLL